MSIANCKHGITRFLYARWHAACDTYAYHRGPGLVAIERIEKLFDETNPCLRRFSFAGILWWFEQATPHDIQDVIRPGGFLGSEADIKILFGRDRKSLWHWAENDRARWLRSEGVEPVERLDCQTFGLPSLRTA